MIQSDATALADRDKNGAEGKSKAEVASLRAELVDRSLLLVTIFGLVALLSTFWRTAGASRGGVQIVYSLSYVSSLFAVLFRRYLPVHVRVTLLFSALCLVGVSSALVFGLAANGVLILAGTCMLFAVLYGMKRGLVAMVCTCLLLIAASVCPKTGWFAPPMDAEHMLFSQGAWGAAIAVFVLLVSIIVYCSGRIQSFLTHAMSELERHRDHLADLVQARTAELLVSNEQLRHEVSERERAESILRESEAKLRNVVEHSNNIFYSHTPDHQLTYVSPQVKNLLGYEPSEVLTRWTNLLTDNPENNRGFELTQAAIETGEKQQDYELEFCHKDGHPIWVEVHEAPAMENGRTVCIVGALHDITQRRRMESERAKLQAQLLQSQKMEAIGRLAGGLAHDFNNMLTGVLSYVDIGRSELPEEHPVRGYLDEVWQDAQRSADLTRQLLGFARKQTVSPKVLDLNSAVETMLSMLRHLIGEDIELIWEPRENAGSVRLDPSQLDQILANFAVNARDAIAGVGQLHIETRCVTIREDECPKFLDATPGDYAMLTISDTGCGMDENTLEHLFEPFYTTKPTGEGVGLGLATIYGIVRQNEGFLEVESQLGKGSTFRVYLPQCAAPVEEVTPPVETGRTPGTNSETILVVEDAKVVRQIVQKFLVREGYTVLEAASPKEAIQLLQQEKHTPIHMVISDIVMPGMNGQDLVRKCMAIQPHMRCLFISGYPKNVITEMGVLDNNVNFLSKPFSRKELLEFVRRILDQP